MSKTSFSEDYFRNKLTPEEYAVLRQNATEPRFCGLYTDSESPGTYHCKACDAPLFTSKAKFHSGSGWPSFFDALDEEKVTLSKDTSHGMIRTEVRCANCDSHLGHVFDYDQAPTGVYFCINSIALDFKPE